METLRGFNTRAVHGGELKDPRFGNVMTPIFESATFLNPNYEPNPYMDRTRNEPYLYTRWGNPTVQSLEEKYAQLEGTEDSMAFSSGMGAISASVLGNFGKGAKILSVRELYGQTYTLFSTFLKSKGIEVDFIDVDKMNAVEFSADRYDMVYGESIVNPTLGVLDLKEIGKACSESGTPLFVDATFATPFNQNPAEFGASVVIHSATKYISGHSDIVLGLSGFSSKFKKGFYEARKNLGASVDPLQAYLALRGMKTLGLRVKRQNETALKIARELSQNSHVERVFYPGLEEFPYHSTAKKVLKGYGGMVSFEVKGGFQEARNFMKNLRIITSATSLGGIESLVTLPVDTSHKSLSREDREKAGIKDNLVRLSVGIEDSDDLMDDLEHALGKMRS